MVVDSLTQLPRPGLCSGSQESAVDDAFAPFPDVDDSDMVGSDIIHALCVWLFEIER